MAYGIIIRADYCWIPDGSGGAAMGQAQANMPGLGASWSPHSIAAAQSAVDMVFEQVPGGDSPTQANFLTALNNAAADLNTRLGTAGATGFSTPSSATLLAVIQGWSTGNP